MPNNSKKNVFKIVLSQKEAGAAVPLIILMVIVSFVNKNFFGLNNLMDVLRTASFWIMIAVPVTFLLCAGGIDLSLGAATSIGGVVCGKALKAGCSIPVAILLALAVGLLIGLVNGVCIVKFNTETEVISTEGTVIPSLYACGEVTGGVHGGNRVGGNALIDCQVFGRIAGEQAAKNAQ